MNPLIKVCFFLAFFWGSAMPQFEQQTIATGLAGGYQVVAADLNRDGRPDLIALASNMPELVWYENPQWTRHVIAGGFSGLINLVVLEERSSPTIVVASGFSSEAKKSPGIVSLLQPGTDVTQPWSVREIDRLPTSHRLRLADIDGSGSKVVINAPLTGADTGGPDYRGRTPLVYYRPGEWRRRLIGDQTEGVMHGIFVLDWDGDGRDEVLAASFVGIHLYKLQRGGSWSRTALAAGDPAPWPKCGASDVTVGSTGGTRFLVAIEPWHGNQLTVYREQDGAWRRQVIDSSFEEGHTVLTVDIDRGGRDEILAGYRGPRCGVYMYTASRDGNTWERQTVDDKIAAASCALTDLDGDGRPEIACIGSRTADLKVYKPIF
jgi:hypothetical protein